uniref:CHHC U11-48K-type domain-containing protein n=1 Tax=Periophthalmus magnuspinnatus TaxID=409849 RepID=A0A3B3ZZJ6_9GOBI
MSACVDPETAQARLERVKELEDFTETCKKQLEHVFTELRWNKHSYCFPVVCHKEELVQCPFDPGHQVPHRSLERHKESCLLKKMDYSSEEQVNTRYRPQIVHGAVSDILFCSSPSGQYSGEPVEVPQNHKRALCDLTVADRLALYDHVTSELSNQEDPAPSSSNEDLYVDLVKKLQKDEEQKEPKTHLELMAEMRDYKRRRQSYRAKNVHITKKSYTEVLSYYLQKFFFFFFLFRDSHSPDDHHEHKKKKKKRRREEREREESKKEEREDK